MANTYYDSELTAEEIEAILEAINGVIDPSNNGKVLAVENGKIIAKSVVWPGANMQSKTVTPDAAGQTVEPDSGYDGLSSVVINGDTDLVAGNIKKDVNIFGITGSYEGGGIIPTGTLNISQNGTYNVTNYASANVNVSGGGGGSTVLKGTEVPTSDIGQNGMIYLLHTPDETGGDVPVEAKEVNYIQSNGNQYINTGLPATSVYGIDFEFEPVSINDAWQSYLCSAQDNFTVAAAGNINSIFFRWRNSEKFRITSGGLARHQLIIADNAMKLDGVTKATVDTTQSIGTDSNNIWIFATSGGSRKSAMKLYGLKMYNASGELLRNFIPCTDPNNVVCLYDTITQGYFYNGGSGSFTAPDPGIILSTYAKVNGVWQSLIGTNQADVSGTTV